MESIPTEICYDAATPVFMRGARNFRQTVDLIGEQVVSRNKLRAALCYFVVADSIVTELTNLNYRFLR